MIAFEKKKKRGSFSSSRSRMIEEQRTPSLSLLLSKMNRYKTNNSMYQNLFSLDYIVNDEKKSVLMSVLNEDFVRMNREERIISSLRAFLSQIDDDAIDEKEDIFFLFFS